MKASILYHSKTGNTKKMAEVIAEGMLSVEGVAAKVFSITEADHEYIKESSCVLFGTPIYLASMSGAMKNWLEGPAFTLDLGGKLGGAFSTADYLHGGGDIGIMHILNHLMVLGMLTYSGGGSFGNPVIHLGPVALRKRLSDCEDVFRIYGQRIATKSKELFTV